MKILKLAASHYISTSDQPFLRQGDNGHFLMKIKLLLFKLTMPIFLYIKPSEHQACLFRKHLMDRRVISGVIYRMCSTLKEEMASILQLMDWTSGACRT